MARKTLGHVELEWTCPNCGGLNPGSLRTCSNCGSPQPDDVEFHQPAHQELVTEKDKLEQATAGPDIHCPYCGTRNPGNAQACSQCGGDLSEGARRAAGQVVGAYETGPVDQIPCPHCNTPNPETAVTCANCGGSLARRPEPERPRPPTKAPAPTRRRSPVAMIALVAFAVIVCGLIGLFLMLLLRTNEITGTVQSVRWERAVPVEAFLPVEREGWIDDLPQEAVVGSCSESLRNVSSNPAPGAVEVCGTPYTLDTGSGFGEVVQDCEYQIYDQYCSYTVDAWQQIDVVSLSGTDFSPIWPEPALQANQRLGEGTSETYACIFTTDEGSYTYSTENLDTFLACEIGSDWKLNVNSLGGVVSIEK